MRENDTEKKLLLHARIQTVILVCILLLAIGAAVFMAGQLAKMGAGMALLSDRLRDLDMEEIGGAIDALHDAADRLDKVDIDSFNRAVAALKGAADNLKDVDVDSLNKVVGALQGSAERLQNAVNSITGIFQR